MINEDTTIDVNTHSLHENYSITVSVTKTELSHVDDMCYSMEVNSKLVSAVPKFNVDENTWCITIGKMRIIRH